MIQTVWIFAGYSVEDTLTAADHPQMHRLIALALVSVCSGLLTNSNSDSDFVLMVQSLAVPYRFGLQTFGHL